MDLTLDKTSPVPLYFQLAEALREHIQSGALAPNTQIPSERELSEQAAISRMTARQAVAYLVRDGTLIVKPGVGTFVAEPKVAYDVLHLLGFTEETIRLGGFVQSQVLEQSVVAAPTRVSAGLNLPAGDPVTKIVRLRLSGDLPLLLETIYIPVVLCPGLEHEDLAAKSLYAVLEQRYGLRLERARQTLEAAHADDYEGALFGIAPGTAMVLIEGVTYLDQGTPAEFFKAVYRGDRIKFVLESYRAQAAQMAAAQRVSLRISSVDAHP